MLNRKNFGRLTEGYVLVIGIGVAIAIAGLIVFGLLLFFNSPWFTVPLIFFFIGTWLAASQWNDLVNLRVVAGFVASITTLTRLTTAATLLNMKKSSFVQSIAKLITRGVVELDFFVDMDAFGPKGSERPNSIPDDDQQKYSRSLTPSQPILTSLQWIGLIGTIIAIIYHIVGLLRYLGFF